MTRFHIRALTAAVCGLMTAATAHAADPALAAKLNVRTAIKPNLATTRALLQAAPKKALPAFVFEGALLGGATADMTGWTVISATATKGGASVIETPTGDQILTTGGDGALYGADFSPLSPALIPSSAWQQITDPGTFRTEPHCVQTYNFNETDQTPGDYEVFCLSTSKTGDALLGIFQHFADYGYAAGVSVQDMGSHKALASPAFLSGIQFEGEHDDGTRAGTLRYPFLAGTFDKSGARLFTAKVPLAFDVGSTGWLTQLPLTVNWNAGPGTFSGAPGCTDQLCGVAAGDAVRLFSNYGMNLTDTGSLSKPLPDGLSGEIGMVKTKKGKTIIVARAKSGQVYQTVFYNKAFTAWKAEGGWMSAQTQPSCVAVNEQATCVIQGGDGKLYAKQLSSSGAM